MERSRLARVFLGIGAGVAVLGFIFVAINFGGDGTLECEGADLNEALGCALTGIVTIVLAFIVAAILLGIGAFLLLTGGVIAASDARHPKDDDEAMED